MLYIHTYTQNGLCAAHYASVVTLPGAFDETMQANTMVWYVELEFQPQAEAQVSERHALTRSLRQTFTSSRIPYFMSRRLSTLAPTS